MRTMAFTPGIAYGVAIMAALALTWMGAKNRQSGWRKERTNDVLDTFMTWAQAHQQLRQPLPRIATNLGPADLGDQLAALTSALHVNAGASMPKTASPAQSASSQTDTRIAADRR